LKSFFHSKPGGAVHRSVAKNPPMSPSGLSKSLRLCPAAHAAGREMPPSGLTCRLPG
jgi:hypothetical protein